MHNNTLLNRYSKQLLISEYGAAFLMLMEGQWRCQNHMNIEYVSAGVILNSCGEVLIGCRSDNKMWEFPGGKRIDRESASVALHREIKEELNIPIYILKPITNITDMSMLNKFVEIRFLLCFCLDFSNIQLSAHSQIMWVPYTELSQINNMYPVDAVVIDNVIDQISKIMNQGDY